MTQTEHELQNVLINQYLSNLDFLKEHDFELFNRINTLSMMIDKEIYKEKFVLEFIKETNEFDILNLLTNEYCYAKYMNLFNKHLLNNSDFSKKSTFCNFIDNLYLVRDKNIEISDSIYDVLDNISLNNLSEFTNIWGNAYSNSKEYLEIDKYFFFGNFLGTHLNDIQAKMKFKCCFIYEDNLEIFRLSLFVTDYKKLNNKFEIIFSVMDDDKDFIEKVNLFLSNKYIYSNYNIKSCQLIEVNNDVVHKIFNELYLSNNATYDYTKMLYINYYFTTKHINKFKILTTKNKCVDFSISNEKPVILIAAGPSLNNNIAWLKDNQHKYILISIGAAYKKLFDNQIIPDIVTTVDPQFNILNNTHFNMEDVKLLQNTIVLASINTPTRILNRFNQKKLYLFEVGNSFKDNTMAYAGISIGEVSLFLLLDMNVKDIYLIGTDLAFDTETGLSHFTGYINKKEEFKNNSSKINDVLTTGISSVSDFIEVKGNKNDKVVTNRMFALSINQYTRIINHYKKNYQNIFNLCENGAYIEGTTILRNKDIGFKQTIDKDFLYTNFEKISEFGLSNQELQILYKRINKVKIVKKSLHKILIKNNSLNILDFNKKLVTFLNDLKESFDKIFINIVLNYFNLVIPYIFYSINDSKLDAENRIKNLRNTEKNLYKQIVNLLDIYESYLEEIKKS